MLLASSLAKSLTLPLAIHGDRAEPIQTPLCSCIVEVVRRPSAPLIRVLAGRTVGGDT
jgi:hypothetical protein